MAPPIKRLSRSEVAAVLSEFSDRVHCDVNTGCWLWSGAASLLGYGFIINNGSKSYTHRASYEAHIGPIPNGMVVMHVCDTPSCINPRHLRCGTQKDNMLDAWSKGRLNNLPKTVMKPGMPHPNARLSVTQVRKIKDLLSAGRKAVEISKMFGVKASTISDIRHGRRWGWLSNA